LARHITPFEKDGDSFNVCLEHMPVDVTGPVLANLNTVVVG